MRVVSGTIIRQKAQHTSTGQRVLGALSANGEWREWVRGVRARALNSRLKSDAMHTRRGEMRLSVW